MKNNILSEELNQMKYLFGYRAGKVISEQQQPAQPTNVNPEFIKLLLEMIKNKSLYSTTPLFPGKIIADPSLQKMQDGRGVYLNYMEFTPSKGLTQTFNKNIDLFSQPNVKLNTVEEVEAALNNNGLSARYGKPMSPEPAPATNLDIMSSVGDGSNPKAFVDFLQKNFGEEQKNILMNQLQNRANGSSEQYNPTPQEARQILQKLNVQPTTQATPAKTAQNEGKRGLRSIVEQTAVLNPTQSPTTNTPTTPTQQK